MRDIYIGIAFIFFGLSATAQHSSRTVFANAGEPLSSENIRLHFTIGEPIVGLIQNGNASLDQGFWAGLNIMDPLAPNTVNETGIVVYPIPVEDELNIATGQRQLFGLQLFAIDRRMVLSTTTDVEQVAHQIDTSTLTPGTYVLQLFLRDENDTVLFKIIKE